LIQADLKFHQAIFRAAGNPICNRLFSMIHRAMVTSIDVTARMVDWDHTLSFHRPIFFAIEKRKPVDARLSMIAHLSDGRSLLEARTKTLDIRSVIDPLTPSPKKVKRKSAG
jgi:GntR family transcriptional repressor for pyruvate dehydrogenase complex